MQMSHWLSNDADMRWRIYTAQMTNDRCSIFDERCKALHRFFCRCFFVAMNIHWQMIEFAEIQYTLMTNIAWASNQHITDLHGVVW